MKMTGAQAIIKALELEGVKTLFGYPGAAICPFYDALIDSSIRHILTRNEQGAAHAASGYARATGRTGVCAATSGPGSTNLITGIATAYMDSVPMVAITGQVASGLIGHDSFQEVDITGATAPFTKHNYLVKSARDLPRIFKEAFYIASTGRPGPVVIDVPQDIQAESIDFEYPEQIVLPGYHPDPAMAPAQAADMIKLIKQSQAPIICAGGGIISGNASDVLQTFVDSFKIPVVTTLMGIGAIPYSHPCYLGTLGSHGAYTANHALLHADLVIIIGARIGNRAMGAASEIARRARIIHIDIDPAEIGKNIRPDLPVVADARQALNLLVTHPADRQFSDWFEKLSNLRHQHAEPVRRKNRLNGTVFPPDLMKRLAELAGPDAIITTEVGQNQIWAANHYRVFRPRTFLSSGGMGTMGYGLPAAIGAKVACPERTVVTISGDGSLQMSLQELGTARQAGLAIKILLLNNRRLGMVHEMQRQKYRGRYSQVHMEHNPDFGLIAAAYGFEYQEVSDDHEVAGAIREMLKDASPYILECRVDPDEPTLYQAGPERTTP